MKKVNERLKKIWDAFSNFWSGLKKSFKILIISIASAMIVTLIVFLIVSENSKYEKIYEGLSNSERAAVVSTLKDAGITDIKTVGGSVSVLKKEADRARMEVAISDVTDQQMNYKISGGMFTTKDEKEIQKLEMLSLNLTSSLKTMPSVENAKVILTPEKDSGVVFSEDKRPPQASVVLSIKEGVNLKNEQIRGIFNIIKNSVSGLDEEHISVTDQNGFPLIPDDTPSDLETTYISQQNMQWQLDFQNKMANQLISQVYNLFDGMYEIKATVSVQLDFDDIIEKDTIYTPSVTGIEDETRGGMVYEEVIKWAAAGQNATGGIPGVTDDADISPDYPAVDEIIDTETYQDYERKINRLVNETIKERNGSDYRVKKINAAVTIDDDTLPETARLQLVELVRAAVGANEDDIISVFATPFRSSSQDTSETGDSISIAFQGSRNIMMILVIMLGVLLVALLFLAIMMSGSKKRRQVRARLATSGVGASDAASALNDFFGTASMHSDFAAVDDYAIQPIKPHADNSREGVLRGEIKDFARMNPDIVAQLIRVLMKE